MHTILAICLSISESLVCTSYCSCTLKLQVNKDNPTLFLRFARIRQPTDLRRKVGMSPALLLRLVRDGRWPVTVATLPDENKSITWYHLWIVILSSASENSLHCMNKHSSKGAFKRPSIYFRFIFLQRSGHSLPHGMTSVLFLCFFTASTVGLNVIQPVTILDISATNTL